jgi:outer membrane protein OmpA-like peptidoglycan-associated protein
MRFPFLLPVFFVSLVGCGREAFVVVLPNPDGTAGTVNIQASEESVLLDRPYAAGNVAGGKVAATTTSAEQIEKIFAAAFAAQPILPSQFRLYFEWDSDTMTPESVHLYRGVFDEIKRRPVYEVEVVGHTDAAGDARHNQQLSLKRAAAVRDQLVSDGVDSYAVSIAGRGELDPVVKSRPDQFEPRNRRVEITVR